VEEQDVIDNNEKVKTIKEMYLTTFLEALTEIDWTSARRGRRLIKTRIKSVYRPYEYEYALPLDCAKPLRIQGGALFEVIGRSIFVEEPKAILLYITNGRRFIETDSKWVKVGDKYVREATEVDQEPVSLSDQIDTEPIDSGEPDDPPDEPEVTRLLGSPVTNYPITGDYLTYEHDEDFPEYTPPQFEPQFYAYIEKSLAAKCALRISNRPELHQLLLQEMMLAQETAQTVSLSSSNSAEKETGWWSEGY